MVGIIPKPIQKASRLYELAPYIVFGLVLAVILAYVIFYYSQIQAVKKLSDLDDRISRVGTKDERALETQLLLDKHRIDDFSGLLRNHTFASNFFKFLEANCHPRVWFTELELNSQSGQVILTGETPNFQTLGQQIVLFQNQSLIRNINVSDLSIGKGGQANFIIALSLDPKIFKNE